MYWFDQKPSQACDNGLTEVTIEPLLVPDPPTDGMGLSGPGMDPSEAGLEESLCGLGEVQMGAANTHPPPPPSKRVLGGIAPRTGEMYHMILNKHDFNTFSPRHGKTSTAFPSTSDK